MTPGYDDSIQFISQVIVTKQGFLFTHRTTRYLRSAPGDDTSMCEQKPCTLSSCAWWDGEDAWTERSVRCGVYRYCSLSLSEDSMGKLGVALDFGEPFITKLCWLRNSTQPHSYACVWTQPIQCSRRSHTKMQEKNTARLEQGRGVGEGGCSFHKGGEVTLDVRPPRRTTVEGNKGQRSVTYGN